MKFIVEQKVFDQLEDVCFGVVFAKDINNRTNINQVSQLLTSSIQQIEAQFASQKVKEAEKIMPYRQAYSKLGINPNKFMSSIEALASRISKKKGFPEINPIVDLGNAISLKYLVPLGAHDVDSATGDIVVRFSHMGDKFIPFGEEAVEVLEEGELIYAAGDQVKTRRWIWRQSEAGKITEDSRNIFFPIDGFNGKNRDSVIAARDELADLLKSLFCSEVQVGFVDRENPQLTFK
ncbi:MAG: hypothetical protein H6Q74_2783 [Firmicutes bacterium]|nr:hypothetical protein [Bacillota bacterium]